MSAQRMRRICRPPSGVSGGGSQAALRSPATLCEFSASIDRSRNVASASTVTTRSTFSGASIDAVRENEPWQASHDVQES
ncbi:MAG: hypothetical protein KF864_08480 [Phycisphaeraceae bacterium]|nr:hypothetical protein [Phycisphaeraceae bacterium]